MKTLIDKTMPITSPNEVGAAHKKNSHTKKIFYASETFWPALLISPVSAPFAAIPNFSPVISPFPAPTEWPITNWTEFAGKSCFFIAPSIDWNLQDETSCLKSKG